MNENKHKVSVVLCTYNGALYIERQLDSIINQTYHIDEIVIVDDCSTDNTRSILERYDNEISVMKLHFNKKNLGSNNAFKYAISLATNNYIALCDQDDIWHENKIEIQMCDIVQNGYDKDTKPLLAFHNLSLIDRNDVITDDSFWNLHKFDADRFNFKKLLLANIVTGCTCIINKSMQEEILKCDMKDIIMHDYLIALIAYGFGNTVHNNRALMYYRDHSSSVTKKIKNTFKDRIISLRNRMMSGEYLLPNIHQIKKFKMLFEENLTDKKRRQIDYFIGLEKKGILSRMRYRWLKV